MSRRGELAARLAELLDVFPRPDGSDAADPPLPEETLVPEPYGCECGALEHDGPHEVALNEDDGGAS